MADKWLPRIAVIAAVAGIAVFAWVKFAGNGDEVGLASGNGRIEAVEVDIAAKSPGRIREILVNEGELVAAGQVVARMDTDVLAAQLRQAEAQLQQARSAVATARSQLALREAEKAANLAVLAQREAELDIAGKRQARSTLLAGEGASSQQEADDDSARVKGAVAAVGAVRAQGAAADAAVAAARTQIVGAESAVAAVQASIERIQADIADSALLAPRAGRIQYRVAQPGEVVGGGGRVLNMVDLADVYMTFFLPTAAAGKLALGDEVRLVLDAAPQYVIPAQVSFVADVAQFTPKTVETAVEREKLMFRVKARLDPDLLRKHILLVKTGLPGMAYVRIDRAAPWPDRLALKLPQ
ncbi:MAG: HlyD family efflux transporter periplasmic adaptor subunit [Gallionellaceae bacterium]|nr:HlyD family efflux transporter periplasmic adaptor subunit [Gallionellaceae bacterium]